jgi:O-antigen/teichoic acid export membrane protein
MATDADKNRYFSTDHLKSDLKGRSVRAGALTVFTQVSRFTLNTGTTIILARILTPADFGLVAMLFAIIMFVEMFRDMGLSSATIQRATITHDQVSTLFWINVVFSLLVAAGICLASPYIADFYNEQRLRHVAYVLALTFFLGGANAQHAALLTRQMRFRALAIITIASITLSSALSIAVAYYTRNYWALVAGYLSLAVFMTIGMAAASGWVPGLPKRRCGIRPMIKYGFNFAAFGFVNNFARSMDSVLIGRAFGSQQLGLYSKAYQLVLMPIQQINVPLTRVAMPALSRLQGEPARYRKFFISAVGMTTFIGMPFVACLFVAAPAAIELMLGPQWLGAVPIFRILGPAAFFGTFNIATGWVYASLGHTDRQLKWGLITSTVTVIGFFIGMPWGPLGIGAAFSIVYCTLTLGPPGFWYCFRGTPLRMRDAWQALWRPGVTSIGAAVVTWFVVTTFLTLPVNAGLSLLVQMAIYTLAYVAAWLMIPDGHRHLLNVWSLLKQMRGKSPALPTTADDGDGAAPAKASTATATTTAASSSSSSAAANDKVKDAEPVAM